MIVVTGAHGFIGHAFCRRAVQTGLVVRRIVRVAADDGEVAVDLAGAGPEALVPLLAGADAVVHLAGRAHRPGETGPAFDRIYGAANERATRVLGRAAVVAGVRRFVFASTVKVNGESTPPHGAFRPTDKPAPGDAYACSKHAAEVALLDAVRASATTAIVLRLPLVYGPGAKGNFRALIDAVRAGRWLPLGAVDNRRSLVGIDNLVDAIAAAVAAPVEAQGVHFVADANSVSTPALVRAIAAALGVSPRMAAVPVPLLRLAASVIGRRGAVDRLTRSLEVDASSFASATDWRPRAFAIDAAAVARER
ncbi:MAG: NAD-dependent epimerase/dehydratase family protein [Betaproteobacteria bacterium]